MAGVSTRNGMARGLPGRLVALAPLALAVFLCGCGTVNFGWEIEGQKSLGAAAPLPGLRWEEGVGKQLCPPHAPKKEGQAGAVAVESRPPASASGRSGGLRRAMAGREVDLPLPG